MFPKSIADAACIIWSIGRPVFKEAGRHIDLRLTTDAGSPLILMQTASECAAIQVAFESPDLEDETLDILLTPDSVETFSRLGDEDHLEFVEFGEMGGYWKDIDEALAAAGGIWNPKSISIPALRGLDLVRFSEVLKAFLILHGDGDPAIRISCNNEPLDVVTFHVPMTDGGVETHIFLMPCRV
jgi:diadenosine tetraphosphatase ApaH/serine/threonine PP2A family protein phosphatase